MVQQSTRQMASQPLTHPKRRDIFFHSLKTFRLLGALLREPRIPVVRKILFLGSVGSLLAILIFPDLFNEALMCTVLPLVGTVLGVPLDAGFDWVAFALVVVNLLRFFPAEVVSEHYNHIFG